MSEPKRGGRPSTEPVEGQKATLGIRASADLKTRLTESAKRNGRSLSAEAELRLEQSYRDEQRADLFHDVVYGSRLAGLAELTAQIQKYAPLRSLMNGTATAEGDWLQEPWDFAAASTVAVNVLAALSPPELAATWQKIHDLLEEVPPALQRRSDHGPNPVAWADQLTRSYLEVVAGTETKTGSDELVRFGKAIRTKLGEDAIPSILAWLRSAGDAIAVGGPNPGQDQ